jgi:multidrug efflux pump subunit AcrA (membrane-fusion protein)
MATASDTPEIETPAAPPVPNPAPAVEAPKPPEAKVETPAAAPVDVEAALAAQRVELELKHSEAVEAAKVEAREAAIADERKRLEDEAKLAAMSEAERTAALLEAEKVERKAAEERTRIAEAATATANRRLEAATARADSGLALARDAAGIVDPALERMAFEELQRLACDKPITPALVVELQTIKPWMFARVEVAHEPTNTGRPASGSRAPERQPAQPSPLTQTAEEWSATKRKLGLAPG